MPYRIFVLPSAQRKLKKLSPDLRRRIRDAVDSLTNYPSVAGIKQLEGEGGFFSLRQGEYHIIFTVDNQETTILIVLVGHRREVYSALRRVLKISKRVDKTKRTRSPRPRGKTQRNKKR